MLIGIGGIFFDDLQGDYFNFVSELAKSLTKQYIPIVAKRYQTKYTYDQKEWQQIRRGRYVEFNLIHDRGTKFGLVTPGVRIESVLMSLPLTCRWEYCHDVEQGSEEYKMLQVLKNPRDWI